MENSTKSPKTSAKLPGVNVLYIGFHQ